MDGVWQFGNDERNLSIVAPPASRRLFSITTSVENLENLKDPLLNLSAWWF